MKAAAAALCAHPVPTRLPARPPPGPLGQIPHCRRPPVCLGASSWLTSPGLSHPPQVLSTHKEPSVVLIDTW